MKLGIISDVHGNAVALAAVMARLRNSVDRILFLGDMVGYYPFVSDCMRYWAPETTVGVAGNHDAAFADCRGRGVPPPDAYRRRYGSALARILEELSPDDAELVAGWPTKRILWLGGAVLRLVHGAPWDELGGRVYPDFRDWDRFLDYPEDVVLLGHTHYPLCKRVHGKLILNPGAVGQPRDRCASACYAVLDLATSEAKHFRASFETAALQEDARLHDPDVPYLAEVLG